MHINSLEFRNVGPFGNRLQRIDFPEEGGLWMVLGRNGAGKSFFVNLPKILLYGRLDRFKKNEIANRLNIHAWIKGTFRTSPETHITIERNFLPSTLLVEKNDNDIGKAGIVDYQTYIDLEVTGLPYHIFSNIISLSINDFKSFISMTPYDKRIIIDKLFAIEIINKMNELVKRDLRDVKMNMDLFDREIISLKNNIDVAVKELQKLKDQIIQDNSLKIIQLSKKLEAYKPKLQNGYDKKKIYENKRTEINEAYSVFQRQRMKIQHDIKHLKEQNDLFKQEKCPTCATPFSESRFNLIKEQLQENIILKNNELNVINSEESKYTLASNKIQEGITTINNFIIQVQTLYNTIEAEMTKLKMDKPKEFTSIQNIISNNTTTLTAKSNEKVKFDEEYKYLAILEQLYSDTGVKKKILESYLPTLNKEIEFTLHELHFPYTLFFNADFEPEMHHLGFEIGVDTLSTGEKKLADITVLISIIRMLKRKYPQLNIFMLDEVLSSLDGDKIFDVLGVLKNSAKELNMNIFVINHSILPIEFFSHKIEIEKNNGFSDLIITHLDE